jgi:hypothetical protein
MKQMTNGAITVVDNEGQKVCFLGKNKLVRLHTSGTVACLLDDGGPQDFLHRPLSMHVQVTRSGPEYLDSIPLAAMLSVRRSKGNANVAQTFAWDGRSFEELMTTLYFNFKLFDSEVSKSLVIASFVPRLPYFYLNFPTAQHLRCNRIPVQKLPLFFNELRITVC